MSSLLFSFDEPAQLGEQRMLVYTGGSGVYFLRSAV